MNHATKIILGILTVLTVCSPAFASGVSGKVNFTGTAPAPTPINMDADPTCAGLHSTPVYVEDIVTNSNNTLKNVFVYIKTGLEGKEFPAPATAITMDQNGCHYMPHVFGLQVGQSVEIINSDATLHNVHAMPTLSKEFNLGMPIKGMKLKKTFDKPEVMVKFKCDVHPWMNAYAGVLTHPFFAVSDDQGNFSIKDLPAGTYTVEAWHEKFGTKTQEITVADGADQTVDFSFEVQ